jgi:hypothetical protein
MGKICGLCGGEVRCVRGFGGKKTYVCKEDDTILGLQEIVCFVWVCVPDLPG